MSEPRLCIVDRRTPVEATEQTCVNCVNRVRNAIRDIVDLYATLPDELADHAGAARPPGSSGPANSDGIPEALVLYAGGTNGNVTSARPSLEDPTGRAHAADQWVTDPPSVVAVLAWWEDDWRTYGGATAQREATVVTCAEYLKDRLTWAAQQHPAFDEFAKDMIALRSAMQVATRSDEVTERGVPCPDCGEQLVRRYRDSRECEHGGSHCDHSHADPVRWGCRGSNTCGCDQGGRANDWHCPNRDCGRDEFTERDYNFAIWANMADRDDQAVESKRETIRGHDGVGDGHVHRRLRYRLEQRDAVVDEAC